MAAAVPGLTVDEATVLRALAQDYHGEVEWQALHFITIMRRAGMASRSKVRALVRGLAAKGFARYERGLFTEDGEPAGSGYRCTGEGLAALSVSEGRAP